MKCWEHHRLPKMIVLGCKEGSLLALGPILMELGECIPMSLVALLGLC